MRERRREMKKTKLKIVWMAGFIFTFMFAQGLGQDASGDKKAQFRMEKITFKLPLKLRGVDKKYLHLIPNNIQLNTNFTEEEKKFVSIEGNYAVYRGEGIIFTNAEEGKVEVPPDDRIIEAMPETPYKTMVRMVKACRNNPLKWEDLCDFYEGRGEKAMETLREKNMVDIYLKAMPQRTNITIICAYKIDHTIVVLFRTPLFTFVVFHKFIQEDGYWKIVAPSELHNFGSYLASYLDYLPIHSMLE